ncbi:hypothetical protein DRN67_00025 [Candidatus Micrarchaeota archaeon]|nr:MAG: hypothetical protein DRN67_00025 [Candidatus Micrarchaeota archaeon]
MPLKAQALTLEAVLALFLSILFIYLLLGTGSVSEWDMRLERGGYDFVNALYMDKEIYSALVEGAERGAYSGAELSLVNQKLSTYVDLLDLGRVDVVVEGAGSFSAVNEKAPEPLNKESFYALLPLRNGEDNRLVEVVVWV